EIQEAYHKVEAIAEGKLLSMLPPELASEFTPMISNQDPEIHAIVKAADKLSAYIKCIEEVKAGNHEFRMAKEQIYEGLKENSLPSLRYFLEHFMGDFELTLDELQQ
ncbi:MAG: YfbR-like 5'-deoxynucleotidase, partial [Eubacteriales bacterium]